MARTRYMVSASIIFLIVIAFFIWQSLSFRITGTLPSLSSFPNVMPYVDINFNKNLASNASISSSPNVVKSYSIKGKLLRINLKALKTGSDYTILLNQVQSEGGQRLTKKLEFMTKDISFSKLPKAVQDAIVGSQDPNDSSLLTNDPLVSHLPYGSLDFNISYSITRSNNAPALVIHVQPILSGADFKLNQADLQRTITTKDQSAIAYIRSLGLDPSKYNIQFDSP